jgi:hypothetical protein
MRSVIGVLLVVAVVAGVAGVASYSYHLGVAQGFAQSDKLPAPGPGTGPYPAYPYSVYPYGYPFHGPFGFGFFGFVWMILFIFLVFALLRGLFWRRHAWVGSWERGVPPWVEEWHRRAHESKGHAGTV